MNALLVAFLLGTAYNQYLQLKLFNSEQFPHGWSVHNNCYMILVPLTISAPPNMG